MKTTLDIDSNVNNWARLEATTEIYFIHKPSEKIWVHFTREVNYDLPPCENNCNSHLTVEGKRFIDMDDIKSITKDRIKKIKKEIIEESAKEELKNLKDNNGRTNKTIT